MARAAASLAAPSRFDRARTAAFKEVYAQEPHSVTASGKTGKAKTAMMRAVAFSKARAAVKR